jgi:hypothetical protein
MFSMMAVASTSLNVSLDSVGQSLLKMLTPLICKQSSAQNMPCDAAPASGSLQPHPPRLKHLADQDVDFNQYFMLHARFMPLYHVVMPFFVIWQIHLLI